MHTTANSTVFDLTSTVHKLSSIDPPRYNSCLQDDLSEILQTIPHSVESDITLESRTSDVNDQIEFQVSQINKQDSHPCLTSTPQSIQLHEVLYQSSGMDLGSSIDFTDLTKTETDELLSEIPQFQGSTISSDYRAILR